MPARRLSPGACSDTSQSASAPAASTAARPKSKGKVPQHYKSGMIQEGCSHVLSGVKQDFV